MSINARRNLHEFYEYSCESGRLCEFSGLHEAGNSKRIDIEITRDKEGLTKSSRTSIGAMPPAAAPGNQPPEATE